MQRPSFNGAVWHSVLCNNGSCPQVAYRDGHVAVRNSDDGDNGPIVVFPADEWDGFVKALEGFTSDKLES
jgi:hypothetical protein